MPHGFEVTVKLAIVTAAALLMSGAQAAYALAQTSAGSVEQLIPAGALTGTAGALVWVVKQIVSGKLVHRDPAEATERLTRALESVTSLAERALEREQFWIDAARADRAKRDAS